MDENFNVEQIYMDASKVHLRNNANTFVIQRPNGEVERLRMVEDCNGNTEILDDIVFRSMDVYAMYMKAFSILRKFRGGL